ncbi:hypothetical protein PENTCL1PPCAC_9110, partial [Pristionchus entomophagus]
ILDFRTFFTLMECLICAEPITHAHLGVNSCRAYAVFYKKNAQSKFHVEPFDNLYPKCLSDPKTTCRLCRFTRFSQILKKAAGNSEPTVSNRSDMDSSDSDRVTFISHESYYDCESSTSQISLLDRLRKGYSLMCLIRHAGEQGTTTKCNEKSQIRIGNLVLVPTTYSSFPNHVKICKEAMKAFATHAFDDFRVLDEESKNFIIQNAHGVMNSLDSAYRATHHFPNDYETRCPGYTTYVRTRDLERFFDNCPDKIDSLKIISEVREAFERSVKGIRRYYNSVNPTDHEFLALLGLALWNDEILNINEKLLHIAMRNRAKIMNELHSYYYEQGQYDYSVRIGHILCALVYFQVNS